MFIERSTGIANILAGRRSQRQLQRVLVQPAGRFVRMSLIKFYLSSSLADYYAGGRDRAGPRVAKWTRIVDEASDLYTRVS